EVGGRIGIDVLLVGLHAVLPLEVLRDRDVARVARQEHHLLAVEVFLGVTMPSVILDVIVVGEQDLGDRAGPIMQIVEADHGALAQAVLQLIDARQQHAQPGPPALAERDHDRIGPAQLAPVVAAAQPALQPTVFLLVHEGQMTRAGAHHLLGYGATELADQEQLIAHGSYESAAIGRPTYRLASRPATPAALPAPVGTRAGCRPPAVSGTDSTRASLSP